MVKVDLSVIIPCFNEEVIFERSVKEIKDVMDLTKLNYELIFVDDGSSDKTGELIKKVCAEDKRFRYIFHSENKGRGAAVKTGIEAAIADVVGFIDIDLSTPPVLIPMFYLKIKMEKYDIVTAYRIYKILEIKKLFYNVVRLILHLGYRFLLKIFFNTGLKDTETGCKFFKRDRILPLIKKIKSKHWFWDTEIMIRGYFEGYKILEVPTLYLRKPEHGSRVRIFKDVIYYLKNLVWFYKEIKK